ncbi:MAG: thiamine diphosphokinase [Candidatus Marinimicrobia bacterium]|jgi:thiamine pyrophosphokinase|nr:thiamine diphosphokinase [Candidatus Neomarinimicrobiota bacterium]MBT6413416.1 thiamine diphosphokinase [Candidatus Neomarinimicrobiota bacterium]|tara:strand:- start:1570 stop:2196 length:627 start_codon:yes stop_codon:yes gene_type:complete
MPFDMTQLISPIVLMGNGEIPSHDIPINIIKNAKTILSADGGANKLNRLEFLPNLILGDLDSITPNQFKCDIIELKDQSKTDLQKSLDWCSENGIMEMSLVGFSGEQDDHWMAALWTLITYFEKMNLTFYSNTSKIVCVNGESKFDSFIGQTISIIPPRENIEISTDGLKYHLSKSILKPPSFSTRNEAIRNSFSIQSNGPVWVFLNY